MRFQTLTCSVLRYRGYTAVKQEMVSLYLCLWVYKWFLLVRFLNFKLSKAALLIKQRFAALYGEICALMESCAALQVP